MSFNNVKNYFQSEENIKLKAVFDLTDTEKYYDPSQWGDEITYQKHNCPGRVIPPETWTNPLL